MTIEEKILIDSFSKKFPKPKKFILLIKFIIIKKYPEFSSPEPVKWDKKGIKSDIDNVSNKILNNERNNKK